MQLPCFLASPPNLAGPYCGQSILRIISKFDATRCQILRLKCTKFDFRWDSAPHLAGGAYSAETPPDPLAVFKGPTSEGSEREDEERERRERKWRARLHLPRTAHVQWHSAGSLGWPFPMPGAKYKYIFSKPKIYGSNFIKRHSETVMV